MPNFLNIKLRKKRAGTKNEPEKELPAVPTAQTFVDKADNEAERVENVDSSLENRKGKAKDTEGVTSGPTEKSKEPEKHNDDKNKNLDSGSKSNVTDEELAFIYVAHEYTMTQIVHTGHSEYVPNAMPMFIILDEALRLMGTSSYLGKYYSNFCPYAVKLGYAFVYYFQIIRAKLHTGTFEGREPSMISRFTKAFPFETIPIPNILFPYFKTIVATKLGDAKYDWIIPSFSTPQHEVPYLYERNGQGRYAISYRNGLEYSCPNIPAMMMILSSFGAETQASLATKLDEGLYRPFAMTGQHAATTGFNLPDASFDFADNAANLQAQDAYTIFRTCGASERFQFWNDDANQARRHLVDSSFFGRGKPAVYATARPLNSQAPQATYRALTTIEEFLFLGKDYSPAFFGYLLENMLTFCKFWKADKYLDDVPTTGGLLTTIKCHLRFNEALTVGQAADTFMYADRTCGLAHPSDVTWYPRRFEGLTANFSTSRGGITRYDELLAFTFGTNSIPPIADIQAGNEIRNFRHGKYFVEDVDPSMRYRLGDVGDATTHGYKPMYEGWTSEVLAKFFEAKPKTN